MMLDWSMPDTDHINRYLQEGYQIYPQVQEQINKVKNEFAVRTTTETRYLSLMRSIDSSILPHARFRQLVTEEHYTNAPYLLSFQLEEKTLLINDQEFPLNEMGYPDYRLIYYYLEDGEINPTPGTITSILINTSVGAHQVYKNNLLDWVNIAKSKVELNKFDFIEAETRYTRFNVTVENLKIQLPKNLHVPHEGLEALIEARLSEVYSQDTINIPDLNFHEIKVNSSS